LRASHARTLLPAALASVPFGFVLVRVRVRFRPLGACEIKKI
jgi:hypothetical protein